MTSVRIILECNGKRQDLGEVETATAALCKIAMMAMTSALDDEEHALLIQANALACIQTNSSADAIDEKVPGRGAVILTIVALAQAYASLQALIDTTGEMSRQAKEASN